MYDIPGFKVVDYDLPAHGRFGYVRYKALFCRFSIAKDMWGTQFCHDGVFFGPRDFRSISEAVEWVSETPLRYESCKRVYRKVWWRSWKYTFSYRHFEHIVWKVIHHFNPDFYLTGSLWNTIRNNFSLDFSTVDLSID